MCFLKWDTLYIYLYKVPTYQQESLLVANYLLLPVIGMVFDKANDLLIHCTLRVIENGNY